MKVGDEIVCKHCRANSFLIKKSIMDGWQKIGEELVCSACAGVIVKLEEEKSKEESRDSKKAESLDKLANFLNTEQEQKPTIDTTGLEKHFCRDCKHYIAHPFLNRCSLHEKEVNPMDDCNSFEKKNAADA